MKQYVLTKKQRMVYDYIRDYIVKNAVSPYIREIQEGCGIQSYKAAVDKLLALEKKGYIRRILNKHRSICLNEVDNNTDTKAAIHEEVVI
jgi:repressor LexA